MAVKGICTSAVFSVIFFGEVLRLPVVSSIIILLVITDLQLNSKFISGDFNLFCFNVLEFKK